MKYPMPSRNAENSEHVYPLQFAAEGGFTDVVRLLLDFGARVDVCTGSNPSALAIATRRGDIDLARLLVQRGADFRSIKKGDWYNLLQNAANKGHLEMTRFFLDLGLDPDEKITEGATALSLATAGKHVAVVNLLLERGRASVVNEATTTLSLATEKSAKRPIFKRIAGRWKRPTAD
jgi:Ankyrin repeats (3 copies)/Ankyrin repeats (many copies)